MTLEVDSIIAVHEASGAPGLVTDINDSDIHALRSWHYAKGTYSLSGAIGCAVDFGNRPQRLTDQQAVEVFNVFAPFGKDGKLTELFCGQAEYCVFQSEWQKWTDLSKANRDLLRPMHLNHVHIAVHPGHILEVPVHAASIQPQESDMSDALTITYATGHKTVVTPDGSVKNAGTPFYGSIYDVLSVDKQDWVSCFAATAVDPEDETKGYNLHNAKANSVYSFTPEWWKEHGSK